MKKNISPRVKPRKRSNGLLLVMTANKNTSALFTLILDYQTIAKGLFKNCSSKSLWQGTFCRTSHIFLKKILFQLVRLCTQLDKTAFRYWGLRTRKPFLTKLPSVSLREDPISYVHFIKDDGKSSSILEYLFTMISHSQLLYHIKD